ncbi:hypothetical protein [Methylopila sp. 73B]|uniref:hypothetical protein n=1 Tax=Methylopila sp. 73B TaxID=1120792 RepID=UPI001AEC6329|nr:hypothetical protein [Methylopila sp. 73B]
MESGMWKPIDTVPRDGTRVMLTNGVWFSAGSLVRHVEPETTSEGKTPQGWSVRQVPNPDAGKVSYYFSLDNPCAFLEEDQDYPDYDRHFDRWEPTHWSEMIPRP